MQRSGTLIIFSSFNVFLYVIVRPNVKALVNSANLVFMKFSDLILAIGIAAKVSIAGTRVMTVVAAEEAALSYSSEFSRIWR